MFRNTYVQQQLKKKRVHEFERELRGVHGRIWREKKEGNDISPKVQIKIQCSSLTGSPGRLP